MVISARPELIGPLGSVLSVEDLHDVVEVLMVDAHNKRILDEISAAEQRSR